MQQGTPAGEAISGIKTAGVHHLAVTVTDPTRSRDFYTGLLGFRVVMDLPNGFIVSNGATALALRTAAKPSPVADQRFDENRVGLDHLALSVSSREALDAAVGVLDRQGVQHGAIQDIGSADSVFLRDPDNIQVELAAPKE